MESILTQAVQAYTLGFEQAVDDAGESNLKVTGRKTKAKPNAHDRDYYLAEGPRWLEAYLAFRRKNYNFQLFQFDDGTPAVEIAFQVPIPGSSAQLRGFIDRVFVDTDTGELVVCDLKTGERDQLSSLQLAVYAYGLSKQFGLEVTKGVYYSAPSGKFSDTFDLRQFPHEYVERMVREAYNRVAHDHLLPLPQFTCQWCSVKDFCYLWNPALERPNFTSDLTQPQESGSSGSLDY